MEKKFTESKFRKILTENNKLKSENEKLKSENEKLKSEIFLLRNDISLLESGLPRNRRRMRELTIQDYYYYAKSLTKPKRGRRKLSLYAACKIIYEENKNKIDSLMLQ